MEFDDNTLVDMGTETDTVNIAQDNLDMAFGNDMVYGQETLSNTVETARDTARNRAQLSRASDLTTNANARNDLSQQMTDFRAADSATNLQARTDILNGAATERAGVTADESQARTDLDDAALSDRSTKWIEAADNRTAIQDEVQNKASDILNFELGQNTVDENTLITNVGDWQDDATGYGMSVEQEAPRPP